MVFMEKLQRDDRCLEALLIEFFSQDNLKLLVDDVGMLLECPLLLLDDTFRVVAHYRPFGFSDPVFQDAVRCGKITYEVGALISQSQALCAGMADYVKLEGSVYRRRFVPLISAEVRLGYFVCIDVDEHLESIPAKIWQTVEQVLAKQMFIEASRRDKPFETAEEILVHLLDGGFSSAPYFHLQAANTYLSNFTPIGFALFELTIYNGLKSGKYHLKDELNERFFDAHPFLYRGEVFLFLHKKTELNELRTLANKFQLKIVVCEGLSDLFELPDLYSTAHEALELMTDARFTGSNVCTVAQLRTSLLLKSIKNYHHLLSQELLALAAHDKDKGTQYCETLYHYLTCGRSLKMTGNALFTHRNTVLYRIRRMQNDYAIPLDDPAAHTDLLLGVSLILFETKGPDFFLQLS